MAYLDRANKVTPSGNGGHVVSTGLLASKARTVTAKTRLQHRLRLEDGDKHTKTRRRWALAATVAMIFLGRTY